MSVLAVRGLLGRAVVVRAAAFPDWRRRYRPWRSSSRCWDEGSAAASSKEGSAASSREVRRNYSREGSAAASSKEGSAASSREASAAASSREVRRNYSKEVSAASSKDGRNYSKEGSSAASSKEKSAASSREASAASSKEVSAASSSSSAVGVGPAIRRTTETASYLGVILVGVGVTSVILGAIFRELFSGDSPNGVYARALDRCLADDRVNDALGPPIKAFGEETRRGRRRYASHVAYEKDGENYLRMHFYLKGSRKRGTVQLEMKQDTNGNYDYRYLFVQLDDYSGRIILLEDNRRAKSSPIESDSESVRFEDFSDSRNISTNF